MRDSLSNKRICRQVNHSFQHRVIWDPSGRNQSHHTFFTSFVKNDSLVIFVSGMASLPNSHCRRLDHIDRHFMYTATNYVKRTLVDLKLPMQTFIEYHEENRSQKCCLEKWSQYITGRDFDKKKRFINTNFQFMGNDRLQRKPGFYTTSHIYYYYHF